MSTLVFLIFWHSSLAASSDVTVFDITLSQISPTCWTDSLPSTERKRFSENTESFILPTSLGMLKK